MMYVIGRECPMKHHKLARCIIRCPYTFLSNSRINALHVERWKRNPRLYTCAVNKFSQRYVLWSSKRVDACRTWCCESHVKKNTYVAPCTCLSCWYTQSMYQVNGPDEHQMHPFNDVCTREESPETRRSGPPPFNDTRWGCGSDHHWAQSPDDLPDKDSWTEHAPPPCLEIHNHHPGSALLVSQ